MQTYPHRIRLRGPWEAQALWHFEQVPGAAARRSDANLPVPGRMQLPGRWRDVGWAGFAGRAEHLRRFGLPRQIDDSERIWLTFGGIEGRAAIRLNGEPLGDADGGGSFEFEVTGRLRPRNELVVTVEADSDAGGLWGEVALEIRRTAYLRNVMAEPGDDGRWRVRGEIAGTAERPLEVYAIAGRANVGYATAEAGTSFELVTEPTRGEPLRVELVDGASVWYAVAAESDSAPGTSAPLRLV